MKTLQAVISQFLDDVVQAARLEVAQEIMGKTSTPKKLKGTPRKRNPVKQSRRSGDVITAQANQLFSIIQHRPLVSARELSRRIGLPIQAVARPIKVLIEDGRIRARGVRRGTKYEVRAKALPAKK